MFAHSSNATSRYSFTVIASILATGVASWSTSARAASIPVNNFSFEDPAAPADPGYSVNPSLPGWTSDGGYYVQLFNLDATLPAVGGVTDGNQYFGLLASGSTTRVYQDTGVAWLPYTPYLLSLAIGNRTGVGGATTIFGLSTDNTAANIQGTPATVDTETAITKASWKTFTYSFSTGAVAPLGNVFIVITKEGLGGDFRVQVDNVQLTTVPEPTSLSLLMLGVIGLWRIGRKRSV